MRAILLDGLWGYGEGRFRPMARAFERHGASRIEIFRYDCSGRSSFESLAREFTAFVRRSPEPAVVLAHSMGGLVLRTALLHEPALPIRRVAFINVPHTGSWAGWLLPFAGIRQMRPGSAFLRRLADQAWEIPSLAIWCPGDLMVLPGSSARWARAHSTECCWVPAHIWPMVSPGWQKRIARFLFQT
ncbi:MAG TPA: alpha/beta fold hydrolase [Chthoniobacterales bacterium]